MPRFRPQTEDAIYKDDKLDIEEYWNLIAARTEDLSDPAKVETYRKVVAAFQSDETEAVFNDQSAATSSRQAGIRTCSLTSKMQPYSAAVSAALSTGRK